MYHATALAVTLKTLVFPSISFILNSMSRKTKQPNINKDQLADFKKNRKKAAAFNNPPSSGNNNKLPNTTPPIRLPKGSENSSILKKETKAQENERRSKEHEELRKLAKVNDREHKENQTNDLNDEEQTTLRRHPLFNNQRFDGIPPPSGPERMKFDNNRREQEMEKQLRLNNTPTPSNAPKPRPR